VELHDRTYDYRRMFADISQQDGVLVSKIAAIELTDECVVARTSRQVADEGLTCQKGYLVFSVLGMTLNCIHIPLSLVAFCTDVS